MSEIIRQHTEGASIAIALEHGARLASLKIGGKELLVTQSDDFLPESPIADDPMAWGSYLMAPWAGRVREGRFIWNGRKVELPLTMPPHAIHGTVYNEPWTQINEASFSREFGPDWPWKGRIRSDFKLEPGSLQWTCTVEAEEPMPITLGWHPWFKRAIDDQGLASFDFQPGKMYQRDPTGIPTGQLVSPSRGPWDDCFTELKSKPRITWPCGLVLELSSSCEHWVVYDERDYAFCIEPQSAPPDAFNLGPTQVASPGAPLVHQMTLEWFQD